MEDPILSYLEHTLHHAPDPAGLMTLHAVLPAGRFTLRQWNNALTLFSGRRVHCRSYQEVGKAIQDMTL